MDGIALSSRDVHVGRQIETLRRQLGAATCDIIAQPGVFELLLNPDGGLWVDRHETGMERAGEMTPDAAEAFIGTVASISRATINRDSPVLECDLPRAAPFRGARFEATAPPVSQDPSFAMRFHSAKLLPLADYVNQGVMTPSQCHAIEAAVLDLRNILVVGATSSGKTTLTNAIIHYRSVVHPNMRPVILQDRAELQCASANKALLFSSVTVSMRQLVQVAMRMRPDTIDIGEVRDGTALDMLKAWNTGHEGGACTVHAPTARRALTRVAQLIAEVSVTPMPELIAEAVNVIVVIAHTKQGRRVQEVVRVDGYCDGAYQLTPLAE